MEPSATGRDQVLFVTSFNREMHGVSGKRLIESWRDHVGSPMLACTEGMREEDVDVDYVYDLDHDTWMHDWLDANSMIIPVHLGGEAVHCDCPEWWKMHTKTHVKGCHWQWMNRNASRWFRKVASIRFAATMPFRYIVWIDSDCHFRKDPMLKFLKRKCFRDEPCFYFRGNRPAPETGIVGFDMQNGGAHVISRWCRQYTTGAFRNHERWDDGYQFGVIMDEGVARGNDMVTNMNLKTLHVMPHTDIWQYIRHDKGLHGRKTGVMK